MYLGLRSDLFTLKTNLDLSSYSKQTIKNTLLVWSSLKVNIFLPTRKPILIPGRLRKKTWPKVWGEMKRIIVVEDIKGKVLQKEPFAIFKLFLYKILLTHPCCILFLENLVLEKGRWGGKKLIFYLHFVLCLDNSKLSRIFVIIMVLWNIIKLSNKLTYQVV